MRPAWVFPILSLALSLTSAAAAPPGHKPLIEEAAKAGEAPSVDTSPASDEPASTTFNGQDVPPMKMLTADKIQDDVSKGYWLVEFFSPYCAHCKHFAPILQTMYELYYTSNPLPSGQKTTDNLNSFTRYYDFKFAKMDCIAFGDECKERGVERFPTLVLYKDGKEVKKEVGAKDLPDLSKMIEEILESVRPGSRPPEGLKLPEVGASSVDTNAKPDVQESKDKDPAAGVAAASKHMSKVNEAATATSAEETPKASQKVVTPSKPKETLNPIGTSIPLTAEKFQTLVTNTRDPWFVKFYAPWCPHCQKLAPNWNEMARDMKGKLNIGEVNCDVEKRLCKDAGVRGYPTMSFFRGGERVEYDGLRGIGDLIRFARDANSIGEGVRDVNAAEFKEMEQTEEVIFLYFYDHATTNEDFQALERLTLSLIGHAKLVKTKDAALAERFKISTWPRLLVSRDGKPSYYTALAPKDMRDFRRVLGWMKTVWLPIVPELTAQNSREIMDGKVVVMGILSRERSDEFIMAKREIKNAALEWIDKQTQAFQLERQELRDAKQLRIEEAEDRNDQRALRAAKSIRINMDEVERKEVGFAWVDGVFWERWIRTTYGVDVREGERVVINDEDNRRYWDNTITGNPIVPSRTSILETLPKVVANPPKISPKSTTSSIERFFWNSRHAVGGHPWLSIIIFVAVVLIVAFLGRRRIFGANQKSFGNTGGYFQLDTEKGGLLGGFGSVPGKID